MDGHELTGFLRRCLADDDHAARAAVKYASPEWHVADDGQTVLWWPALRHLAEPEAENGWRGQTIEHGGDRLAPHIARWDPARVLVEVEVRTRLVDAYEAALTRPDTSEDVRRALEWTLRVLVAGYAGRDGFREEWRLPGHDASERSA